MIELTKLIGFTAHLTATYAACTWNNSPNEARSLGHGQTSCASFHIADTNNHDQHWLLHSRLFEQHMARLLVQDLSLSEWVRRQDQAGRLRKEVVPLCAYHEPAGAHLTIGTSNVLL